jgi:hypothetical protein
MIVLEVFRNEIKETISMLLEASKVSSLVINQGKTKKCAYYGTITMSL